MAWQIPLMRCFARRRRHFVWRVPLLAVFIIAFVFLIVINDKSSGVRLREWALPGVVLRAQRLEGSEQIQPVLPRSADVQLYSFVNFHKHPQMQQTPASTPHSIDEQLIARYRVDMDYRLAPGQSPWQVANDWVNSHKILPDEAPELGAVLKAMATAKITAVEDRGRGWHNGHMPKMFIQLEGGQWTIFKPQWYARDFAFEENMGCLCCAQDIHTSEIASFHIARILGLRNVPIAVGRTITLGKDVLPVAKKSLLDTAFFKPETNETCIRGNCTVCNWDQYTICRKLEQPLEGVMILMLPEAAAIEGYVLVHPWFYLCEKKYINDTIRLTETRPDYCQELLYSQVEPVRRRKPNIFHNNTGLLLDLLDSGIFHYLVTNYDRKLYTVQHGPYKGLLVNLDNGKSFVHPERDMRLIMAPVWHCCIVRRSTYERLLLLQNGTLGRVVRAVLDADPISPVLTEPLYAALDRRLAHVLHEIQRCIDTRGRHYVFRYG